MTFLAADTYKVLGSVDVGRSPTTATFGADERFLYVIHEGGDEAPSLAGTRYASVVDVESRTLVATLGLGFEPRRLYFSADGTRLIAFSRGRARGVVTVVDRATHRVLASTETAPDGLDVVASPDARWLFALHKTPATLVVVDTRDSVVAGEVKLPREPLQMALSNDGRLLYILDGGTEEGRLSVVEVGTRQVAARVDVGSEPRGMQIDPETGRVYVLARSDPETRRGVVRAIQGAEVVGRLLLGRDPPKSMSLALDGRMLLVLCTRSLWVLDTAGRNEAGQVPLDFEPAGVLLSSDGRRAYVSERTGSTLVLLDVEGPRVREVVETGRGGKLRALIGLAGTLAEAAVLGHSAHHGVASLGSSTEGHPLVHTLERGFWLVDDLGALGALAHAAAPDSAPLVLRDDGRFLYALNTLSNDVTILDAATGGIVERIPAGEGRSQIVRPPVGRHLYVRSPTDLSVIDTRRNALLQKHSLSAQTGPPSRIAFSPAHRAAFVPDGRGLHVLSLRTGAEERFVDLPSPRLILVPSAHEALGERQRTIEENLDRATAFEQDGDVEAAIELYRETRSLAPDDEEVLNGLLGVYSKTARSEAAYAELLKWAEAAPSDPRRCWRVGALFVGKGRLAAAAPYLECALAGAPSLSVAPQLVHYELARSLQAAGDRERALHHAREARRVGDRRADRLLKEIRRAK